MSARDALLHDQLLAQLVPLLFNRNRFSVPRNLADDRGRQYGEWAG